MRKLLQLCPFADLMLSSIAPSYADAVLVPPGLAAGSTYRIIFVTDAVTYGNDPTHTVNYDSAYFNNFVTADAEANAGLAALNTTWTALASTYATNVLTNAVRRRR